MTRRTMLLALAAAHRAEEVVEEAVEEACICTRRADCQHKAGNRNFEP